MYAPPFTFFTNSTGRVLLEELASGVPLVFDLVPWGLNHNGEVWNHLNTDMSVTTYTDDGSLYDEVNGNNLDAVLHDNPTFEAILEDYFTN